MPLVRTWQYLGPLECEYIVCLGLSIVLYRVYVYCWFYCTGLHLNQVRDSTFRSICARHQLSKYIGGHNLVLQW